MVSIPDQIMFKSPEVEEHRTSSGKCEEEWLVVYYVGQQ